MDGKVYLTDLFTNEEISESSPKKPRIEKQNLPLDDPMDIDQPEENLLKPNYSAFITRLSECFLRSEAILKSMGDPYFNDFVRRYSANVAEGLDLFSRFRHYEQHPGLNGYYFASIVEVVSHITHREEFKNHFKDGKLSIVEQLEQVRARWRSHSWILENTSFIKWLKSRSGYYPLLLGQLVGQDSQIKGNLHPLSRYRFLSTNTRGNRALLNRSTISLSKVEVEWLVDLVHPHLKSESAEDDIACVLTHPSKHQSLLKFSAMIDQINLIKPEIIKSEGILRENLLRLVGKERAFFRSLMADDDTLRPYFIKYLDANPPAKRFVMRIRMYQKRLLELLAIDDLSVPLDSAQIKAFKPLLFVLFEGFLNNRLEMLITLSKIGDHSPEHTVLTALTWLEKNRETIALIFDTHAWEVWSHQLQASSKNSTQVSTLLGLIRFSENITSLITAKCFDVRQGKQTADEYPCSLACFLDALSGLAAKDRSGLISYGEHDVLLYQFLSDPRNACLPLNILKNSASVQIHIDALKEYIAEQRVTMLDLAMVETLSELTNSPRKSNPNSPRKVTMPPAQKRYKKAFENEEISTTSAMKI